MAGAGTIQGTFGWDNTPFVQGMRQAEQVAARSTGSIEHRLEHLFRRDPGRRAERAIGGAFTQLAQGNIPGAIESISGKMAGLGIAAGVGIGLVIEGFQSLSEHTKESRKLQEEFQDVMSKPVEMIIDSGQADAAIQKAEEAAVKLKENYESVWETVRKIYFGGITNSGAENADAASEQQQQNALHARVQEIARARGRHEMDVANAQTDPTNAGRLTESMMKFDAEKGKAESAARDNPDLVKGLRDELAAIEKRRKYAADAIAEQDEANQREFETARNVTALRVSGVSEETAKRIAAEYRIQDIQASLAGRTLSDPQRRQLETERGNAAAGLQEAAFKRAQSDLQKTPEQREAELAGRLRDQHEAEFFGKTGRLTPSDVDLATKMGQNEAHVRMGTWDYSTGKDEVGAKEPMSKADLEDVMQKYWGKS